MHRLLGTCLLSVCVLSLFVPGCAAEEAPPARLKSTGKKPTPPPKTGGDDSQTDGVPTKAEPAPSDPAPASEGAATLTAVSPDAITLGTAPTAGVDVTITGTRFADGMKIDLAGDLIETTMGGPTSLTAKIPANKLQASGVYRLALVKSGAQSNALTFTVANPTSVLISNITPATATIGATAPITLAITGNGFVPASVVRFNGATLTTKFTSATALEATIPASAFLDAGKYGVTVSNGVDVVSLPTSFEVRNPIPSTTSMTPTSATAGGAALAVTLNGTGFTKASQVLASGSPLATTYLSATQLRATLPSTMLATAKTLSLVVQSPGPGGGTTGGRTFTVNAAAGTSSSSGGTPPPNPNCLYHCDDYGYAPGQCYEGWVCIASGTYAGCLGQTQCSL